MPAFRKELKIALIQYIYIPQPHGTLFAHVLFSLAWGTCCNSSPPWIPKNQTFFLGWLPSQFSVVFCFYWVDFQAKTQLFALGNSEARSTHMSGGRCQTKAGPSAAERSSSRYLRCLGSHTLEELFNCPSCKSLFQTSFFKCPLFSNPGQGKREMLLEFWFTTATIA